MAETLLLSLPSLPDAARPEAHWWHVVDGEVVARGDDFGWRDIARAGCTIIGLAPVAAVTLKFMEPASSASSPRQAAAVARVAAVSASLGDDEALHAVSGPWPDGTMATAVVDNGRMVAWLDWGQALGVGIDRIVPAASLLPLGADWCVASFGDQHVVGRAGLVIPNEPELVQFIVGGSDVRELEDVEADAALAGAAEAPLLDLRTGRFARRQGFALDRGRIRELALLAALIPLLTLAWALVSVVKVERSTARLDAETLQVAERALGHATTLETVESELSQRFGGTAGAGAIPSLAAVVAAIQPEANVSSTNLSYTPDGTLAVTLAAPAVDPLNRVLVSLQREGFGVTAVPRQSSDGRSMVDMTVRGAP